jgi:hypothetical protein
MGILVIYLFTKHRSAGLQELLALCNTAMCAAICHVRHAEADGRDGEHLSPPNILLSNFVDQRLALCASLCHVAGTLLSKTFTRHTN